MSQSPDLDALWMAFSQLKSAAITLQRYKGNKFYKNRYDANRNNLNRLMTFTKARIAKSRNESLKSQFVRVGSLFDKILTSATLPEIISEVEKLELFWPEFEIAIGRHGLGVEFEIPKEIPIADYRLDLEEAIKDYENGCYLSSLVMCRRAYESALVTLFKAKTNREPIEDQKCKHCKSTIRANAYIGITRLHDWAINNGYVTERLRQVGFLVPDIGAGAAHPPLSPFPRDQEIAKLGISAAIALTKQIALA